MFRVGRIHVLFLFFFAIATVSCATPIKTHFDRDTAADFSQYRTFAWVGPEPLARAKQGSTSPGFISALDDQSLRRAVDRTLTSKGYTRVPEADQADLAIAYSVGSEDKVRVQQSLGVAAVHSYPSRYRYGSWYTGSTVNVQQYTEGTLSIEAYDQKTEQPVWVGWASKRLSRNDDSQKLINEAVSRILTPFPPAPAR